MNTAGCFVKQVQCMSVIRDIIAVHDQTWGRSLGILDLLSNSTSCLVITDEEKKVQGYCFVEEDEARGFFELQDIAVSPLSRSRGLGRKLMQAAMDSCSKIKIMTRANRPESVAFFERLGFVREQHVENYYDVGDDALRMCWTS